MRVTLRRSFYALFAASALSTTASAATRYVDINCATPSPPYTDWATAATNIQEAIDAAAYPDEIVVGDGVYATGGVSYGGMTNRVYISKRVTVRSVNGPARTIIEGAKSGSGTNGLAGIRCVNLGPYAVLSGFTLTNGGTTATGTYARGGGVYCANDNDAVVTNCVLVANSAGDRGGGAYSGSLQNCLFYGNSAPLGGGVYGSRVDNSSLIRNSADRGGAAYEGFLSNCLLTENWAKHGGGAFNGQLYFCTVTANSAKYGGGAAGGGLLNCIVYFNEAWRDSPNYSGGRLDFCCTTPMPASGTGNIAVDPQLASLSHLSADSPCRGAAGFVRPIVTDIDGEPWADPAPIGCDEYYPDSATGALAVAISAPFTNFAVGFSAGFKALIDGRTSASVWDFGDGVTLSNRPCANHAWASSGTYEIVLTAYNTSSPEGVRDRVTVHVSEAATRYVNVASTNPAPPFASWATAAMDIQSAVDAALPGEFVVVADGVYSTGGRAVTTIMTNRVVVDKPLTIRSLNGPTRTAVHGCPSPGGGTGDGATRCLWLTNNTIFSGFTLTNGATRSSGGDVDFDGGGGGAWCGSPSAILQNCVLVGNIAIIGGGACGGTLNNCVLALNRSTQDGAGGYSSLLNNCTVVSHPNRVFYSGALNNCIVYSNTGTPFLTACTNSCIVPLLTGGVGNFAIPPLFVDLANLDLRLQSNSPCINAGRNAAADWSTDLDGNPRIAGGTVDVGAYEFQSPASTISYAWLQGWGLPCDGSADPADCDGDGMSAWQEWVADTSPTNSESALRIVTLASSPRAAMLTWTSSTNRSYSVQRATILGAEAVFTPVASDIPGRATTTSFTDTNAPVPGPALYRVGVRSP